MLPVNGDEIVPWQPGTYTSTQDGHVAQHEGQGHHYAGQWKRSMEMEDWQSLSMLENAATWNCVIVSGETVIGTVIEGPGPYRGGESSQWRWNANAGTTSPTVMREVRFMGNSADDGGGIFCYENSSPTITRLHDRGQHCYRLVGHRRRDLLRYGSNPTISGCTITKAITANYGGGIYCWDESNPTITYCNISGNTANNGWRNLLRLREQPHHHRLHDLRQHGENINGGWDLLLGRRQSYHHQLHDLESNITASNDGGGIVCQYKQQPHHHRLYHLGQHRQVIPKVAGSLSTQQQQP